jgi:aminoglycoside phosphotransferase (APT) family kinase protein
LQQKTTIPLPKIALDWNDGGRHFIVTERIPGEPLSEMWVKMSAYERESIAKQVADYLLQLRSIHSARMQGLNGEPIYSAFLFRNGYGLAHGPLSSNDELWADMDIALKEVPEDVRIQLRKRMPPAEPFTFTHGDLTFVNIMVKDGRVTGILDWESSGFFPVWWEFTCAGIGLSEEDVEWKNLLRKHMHAHSEAREFWRDYYALSKYPNLDERGTALLKDRNRQ